MEVHISVEQYYHKMLETKYNLSSKVKCRMTLMISLVITIIKINMEAYIQKTCYTFEVDDINENNEYVAKVVNDMKYFKSIAITLRKIQLFLIFTKCCNKILIPLDPLF